MLLVPEWNECASDIVMGALVEALLALQTDEPDIRPQVRLCAWLFGVTFQWSFADDVSASNAASTDNSQVLFVRIMSLCVQQLVLVSTHLDIRCPCL